MNTSLRQFLPHVSAARPVFLCCDIQTKFRGPIAVPRFDQATFIARRFYQYYQFQTEHCQFVATEQVPNKLGELDPSIGIPQEMKHSKTLFSMLTPEVEKIVQGRDTFVLFGIEAHVCILQTAASLLERQKRVFIAADGTFSQRDEDRDVALQTLREAGAIISTSESILLQLTKDATDEKFRATSALLKQRPEEKK